MKKTVGKYLISLVVLLCMTLPATSCSKNPQSSVVEIRAGIQDNAVVDYSNMQFIADLEKATNVKFQLEEMTVDKIALMFNSGDFVDVLFGGATDQQITVAANSGDIVDIGALLPGNAPTWEKAFAENPSYKAATVFSDNKIWSLPYIRTLEADRGIRDVWWINQKWMDELNLKMPATLDDFTKILKAFKDNAGKGSIPANVMPWYYLSNSIIGGQFDFLATFGLPVYDYTYMAVKNQKVENYATDSILKEALKTLIKMKKDGLIPEETFKDNTNNYMQRTNTVNTPNIGVFTAYATPMEDYVAMPVFESKQGVKPLIRRQPLGVTRNRMVIFKNCKNPASVMKAMEYIVQPDNQMYLDFGLKDTQWVKNGDKYLVKYLKEAPKDVTPGNAFPGLLDDRFKGLIEFEEGHGWYKREKAVTDYYENNRMDLNEILPPLSYSQDETKKINDYRTKICAQYINATINNWINGKTDIDAGWDAYVSKVKEMGMPDYVSTIQAALDRFYLASK